MVDIVQRVPDYDCRTLRICGFEHFSIYQADICRAIFLQELNCIWYLSLQFCIHSLHKKVKISTLTVMEEGSIALLSRASLYY